VVEISGGAPHWSTKLSTDANGRFSAKNIPSGMYWINYTLAGGWVVHDHDKAARIKVEPATPLELTVRGERPYRERLKAAVVLDKSTYAVGDTATVTVTLTNIDDRVISGVQAGCNRGEDIHPGENHHLGGTGLVPMPETWGDLRPSAPGVTLNPGETKTFVIAEKVPAAAKWIRKVVVACDFAPNSRYNTDGAFGYDWASLPGGSGGMKVRLFHYPNHSGQGGYGEAIAHTRVMMMTDKVNGFLVAEAVSDAQGYVHFEKIPPGEFWLVIDGPWMFQGEWGGRVRVYDGTVWEDTLSVVPGPPPGSRPDGGEPQESPPGSEVDTVDTGTAGALARTGASVLGLGVLAVLLVAFGIGARVAGRRKTV
jgi:hypothetical protein